VVSLLGRGQGKNLNRHSRRRREQAAGSGGALHHRNKVIKYRDRGAGDVYIKLLLCVAAGECDEDIMEQLGWAGSPLLLLVCVDARCVCVCAAAGV
jgi:hypothetical protein